MAQSVEHVLGKDEVTSSSLVSSSKKCSVNAEHFLYPNRSASKVWHIIAPTGADIIKGNALVYHHGESRA